MQALQVPDREVGSINDGGETEVDSGLNDDRLLQVAKALSCPVRQEIILLLGGGPHFVGEIVEQFQLAQPTISRHLNVLLEAGLVTNERQAQHVLYSIQEETLVRYLETIKARHPKAFQKKVNN
jgi:DNA-binding transcriptional ArsR family regulator